MRAAFILFLLAATTLLSQAAFAQDVSAQAAKSWVKRYTRPPLDTGAVVHPYENGFCWDADHQVGVVFGGHLGTTYDMRNTWPDFGEVYNTNQTWMYNHAQSAFTVTHPVFRPQKTCGGKIYYDDVLKRIVLYGGAFHASDNGYWEVDPAGNLLVKEDKQTSGI